jgi:epsilon-lactone hydrolase
MPDKGSDYSSGYLLLVLSALVCAILIGAFAPVCLPAQAAQAAVVPATDTTTIDADGTAHITRVLPLPRTVSPEAQKLLATGETWAPGPNSPETAQLIAKARELYPVRDQAASIAGVPVRVFMPPSVPADKSDRVLINLHGGGFMVDASSYLESIPIASLTQTKVVSVYYRLASKAPFPAAVDDAVAVYKELLKTYKPANIAIYGTSAGAILTGQVAVRLKHDGLPEPGALGFFTGHADFSAPGDSQAFYAVPGLVGARPPESEATRPYMKGVANVKDPLVSPIYADLSGLPPTLCITGTRDLFLSATSTFERALLRAGVNAQLVVFDSMPHAFWFMIGTPESKEALNTMAQFFDAHLGGK